MSRGSRLPEDWKPTPELVQYAKSVGVTDVQRMTEDFTDFWLAKAGKDAVKLDWSRTWKTWARRDGDKCREKAAREHRWNNKPEQPLVTYSESRQKQRYQWPEDKPSTVTVTQEEIEAAERWKRRNALRAMN